MLVYRCRPPAVVHQDHRGVQARDHGGERWVVRQRGDVVDDCRARIDRAAGDAGFVRVDRDGNGNAAAKAGDDGQHASQLLVLRKRFGARPRGLAANVEEIGAVGDHAFAVSNRALGVEAHAAIGERIRRDVDHSHDEGTRAQFERASVR